MSTGGQCSADLSHLPPSLRRLVQEQEQARKAAERDERNAQRRAARAAAQAERELARLIAEQDAARRQAEREERARTRRRLARAQTGAARQQAALDRFAEEMEARRAAAHAAALVAEAERQRVLALARSFVTRRVQRGRGVTGSIRFGRRAIIEVQEQIDSILFDAFTCLQNLGLKVVKPRAFVYRDGTYDAEIKVTSPPDKSGGQTVLTMAQCLKPVDGAWFTIGARFEPSAKIDDRIEQVSMHGVPMPPSLTVREADGRYPVSLNYAPATEGDLSERELVAAQMLESFSNNNDSQCAEIFVRYFLAPDGNRPPSPVKR